MSIKVFLHVPDDHACSVYRTKLPALHLYSQLSKAGVHITAEDKTLPNEKFDIYLFNRLIRVDFYKTVVDSLLKMGKQLIWQCDDNLWKIPNWNPSHNLLKLEDLESTNSYIENCKNLWVSTHELAKFVNYPEKTFVLPNLVDLNQFDEHIVRDSEPIKIVWCGSASHDKDLDVIINSIKEILNKFGNKIAVIFWGYLPTGLAKFERHPGLPYASIMPKFDNLYYGEWFSNREYFFKLRDLKPDIAIMPLHDCEFNYSKSNLKYLEMSMAGAACVATDLPPYNCIQNHQTGIRIKAGDENGWLETLTQLIEDKQYRIQLNDTARKQIANEYSWQCPTANLWLDAFLKTMV